jgi:hypothetical protein
MSSTAQSGHERYEELVVGHALHALEPEDEVTAGEHLRVCDSCRRLAADTEAVGSALAALAPPVQPPAELGERLRAAVAAEPRGVPAGSVRALRPRVDDDRAGRGRAGRTAPAERPAERPAAGRPPRGAGGRGRWLRAAPWLVTAAAVAALAVVTGWGTSISSERDQLVRAADLREQVLDRLADPAARVVRLAGQEDGDAGAASAAVLLDEGGRAYVVAEGLAPNDPDSTYVLWQVPEGGAPQAVGVFDVPAGAATGVAVAEVGAVTLGPEQLAALAVSREAGRVAPPTPSTPVLVGTTA